MAESARWGDVRYDDPVTLDDWRLARDNVLEQMDGNAAKLIELARGKVATIRPLTRRSLASRRVCSTKMWCWRWIASLDTTFYTLDGSDPRAPGSGLPSESAA